MKKTPTINCQLRKTCLHFYTLLMGLLLCLQLSSQDIYIDLNAPRQGIDGAGFCHEGDRQNGNYYVINTAIQQMLDNHMTLFRDMFPNKTFAPSKGNYNYTDDRVKNSYNRLKTMQYRGIKTILGIWDVPNWMVSNPSAGNNRKINNFDDFANFITAFLVYGKNNYNLKVDYVDVNETKTSGINLNLTAQEYITLIQKCQALFTANGIQTKMNIGSVMLWDIQYCKDIYNAVNGLSVAGYPSWHTYKGSAAREPVSYWENWGAWQQTLNRNLWGTETDYDAFYWENPDRLTWQGVEEMAVMYYRNYYVARMSTSAGWYWHPEWPSNNVHTAYMNHFEPGGQIVETSQPSGDIMTVAYKHQANQKFVIQVVNQASAARTVTFHGVPANKPLTLVRTSEAGDRNNTVGTYTPFGTNLTITLQANSFNTFYGDLATTTTDTQAPSVPANFRSTGQTTTTLSLAWDASTDNVGVAGYQVFYPGNVLAGSSTGTTLTLQNLTANTSYTLVVKAYDAAGNFSAGSTALTVQTSPASAGPNLAYNRPVFTTSNENTTNTGDKAVDANGNTRWSSSYTNNQSIVVDLGSNYNVNRVRLAWEDAYARDYQIQFSTNNTTWTTVREFWGKTSAAADNQTGLTGLARYVKVYCINRATTYGFSLFEFEVYGTAPGARQMAADPGDASVKDVSISPNPATDQVTVQLPASWQQHTLLELVNSDGKRIISKPVTGAVQTVRLSSLPKGLYILRLSNGGQLVTHKIVKQ